MTILWFGSPRVGIWIVFLSVVLPHFASAVDLCRILVGCGRVRVAVQALEVGKPLHPVGERSPTSVAVCTSHLAISPRAYGDNTYHVLSLALPSMPFWTTMRVWFKVEVKKKIRGHLRSFVRRADDE